MRIFALETSARAVSVALTENGKVLASAYQDTGLTHSRTLMPLAESVLRNVGLSARDMDAFAVAAGPGSFTGIRIGVAAAKGLALGAERPAVGVSTLAALARNVASADALIIAAMDARRSQIYEASFRAHNGALERLTPDRALALSELADELSGETAPIIVAGDGAALCAAYLNGRGVQCRTAPPNLVMQNAVSVALEAEALPESAFVTAQELRPTYLRPPQALPLRERRKSRI
jgi:tRNA threonylcarbamoyladenosine biosynthesis protein TsaB